MYMVCVWHVRTLRLVVRHIDMVLLPSSQWDVSFLENIFLFVCEHSSVRGRPACECGAQRRIHAWDARSRPRATLTARLTPLPLVGWRAGAGRPNCLLFAEASPHPYLFPLLIMRTLEHTHRACLRAPFAVLSTAKVYSVTISGRYMCVPHVYGVCLTCSDASPGRSAHRRGASTVFTVGCKFP